MWKQNSSDTFQRRHCETVRSNHYYFLFRKFLTVFSFSLLWFWFVPKVMNLPKQKCIFETLLESKSKSKRKLLPRKVFPGKSLLLRLDGFRMQSWLSFSQRRIDQCVVDRQKKRYRSEEETFQKFPPRRRKRKFFPWKFLWTFFSLSIQVTLNGLSYLRSASLFYF